MGLMKEDGVEYNLENLDTRALSDAKSKELLLRLRKASDLIKSTQRQDTILYLKFDKPPDRYSADFTELLTIRYRDGPHPLRDFLLQLSLPALLKVSHDLTIKCLSDNQQYLNDFAKYAGKNAELQAPFVRRAEDVLPEDCKVHFHRDHAIYQSSLTSSPVVFIADTTPSQPSPQNHFRVAATVEQQSTAGRDSIVYKQRARRS